jgi:coenzyme F420-0:L-glutamate ligase
MIITPIKTRIFREKENLIAFIRKYLPRLEEKSILIITSKIVALSEGRTASIKNTKTKEQLIKKESQWAIKTKYAWLTIKDGAVMAAAGIDESNAAGKLILLPKNSFHSAEKIRKEIKKIYGVKKLGVVITDSRLLPLRAGVVGIALGYAGFKGIKDYIGKKDLFGRKFEHSRTDVADSIATAAVLEMGEGKESQPLAVIEKGPVEFTNRKARNELFIDPKEDLYRPFFEQIKQIKSV